MACDGELGFTFVLISTYEQYTLVSTCSGLSLNECNKFQLTYPARIVLLLTQHNKFQRYLYYSYCISLVLKSIDCAMKQEYFNDALRQCASTDIRKNFGCWNITRVEYEDW